MSINAMYFLLIRRQRRPCLLAIDDGLSLAGQHAGRGYTSSGRCYVAEIKKYNCVPAVTDFIEPPVVLLAKRLILIIHSHGRHINITSDNSVLLYLLQTLFLPRNCRQC